MWYFLFSIVIISLLIVTRKMNIEIENEKNNLLEQIKISEKLSNELKKCEENIIVLSNTLEEKDTILKEDIETNKVKLENQNSEIKDCGEQILFLKNLLEEKEKVLKELKNENLEQSKICENINEKLEKCEENILILNKVLKDKNIQLDELRLQIQQLKKELSNYTEITNDSLNLNISDAENFENSSSEAVNDETTSEDRSQNSELNSEKEILYELMEKTNGNMFITGKAGTGKSYLLKYFRKNTKKKVLYTAPTGIAALNIQGVTIHSAFGFSNLADGSQLKLSRNKLTLFKQIDTLVIDEISMVRVDVFNQIDKILKVANNNELPFGGKQVILFGDLFQLPPVANEDEVKFFTQKYNGIFFFNAPAYELGNFLFKELEEVFRQTDEKFISILNNIREGRIKKEDISLLNSRYVEEVPRRVVQVVPTRAIANTINTNSLEDINSKEYIYNAEIILGENLIKETDFSCDFELKLKVGALVMMIVNDQENKRWVNGTLGIISKLSENNVIVKIDGVDYEISPVAFSKYKCELDKETQQLTYVEEASIKQYPLIPAYAITIHKSQGMTYQQIACNLQSCFAPGQAYVALSRCANFDKLYLTEKINANSIITSNVVTNFYESMKNDLIEEN